MAEGQIKKDLLKKAAKKPAEPTKPTESEGSSPEPVSNPPAEDTEESNLAKRRGIASGLKNLSRENKLTSDLFKQARSRATEAGVTEEQFDSFLDRNEISKPAESKEEAAQNVMFQRQYGTGLGTLKAMQDPKYELGSGSALRQPARQIGPASGKFRRAARRLRRKGYGGAAQQMAMLGEMARMGEPSIDTPALRGQRMLQRMVAAKEARKQDKLAAKNPLPPTNNQPDLKEPMAPVSETGVDSKTPKVVSYTDQANADRAARDKERKESRNKRRNRRNEQ